MKYTKSRIRPCSRTTISMTLFCCRAHPSSLTLNSSSGQATPAVAPIFQHFRLSLRPVSCSGKSHLARPCCITWRLDYCNSVLLEIPLAQIERLQRTQIKAARFIVRTRQREHITPVLRALHRLPVCHRIQIKVRVNVFKCLHGLSPDYLTELVHVHRRDNRLRQPDTFMLSEQVTIRVIRKRVNVRASNAFNQ